MYPRFPLVIPLKIFIKRLMSQNDRFEFELAIFVASIVQVREEGWTNGMRESGLINKKED